MSSASTLRLVMQASRHRVCTQLLMPAAPSFAPRSNVEATGGFKVPPGSKLRLPLYPVGLIKE